MGTVWHDKYYEDTEILEFKQFLKQDNISLYEE